MNRNPTPRLIATLSALIAALAPAVVVAVFGGSFIQIIAIYGVTLILSYAVFVYFIERFIYRKIKLIYKNIHRFKRQQMTGQSGSELDKDPISEVTQEVFSWARDNRNEIESLKRQESFRKEFLGNVAHELKTPITTIQGYIDTLLDGALHDQDVNEMFLMKTSQNVDRLKELIDDLMSISHLETGEMEIHMTKWDIKELCKEVNDSLELKAKKKNMVLKFKENANKSWDVKADMSKIRQVVSNLLVNAIKYGKENGNVRIGFYDMDKNILVEITDDGDGIAQEHLPRLFERFYRIDKHRNREMGGSGLGLAIVKHILEAHQQTINVRSTVGQGTTFAFTLTKA